jgi:hypothetical protein
MMLRIREEQMKVFEVAALRNFEDEMVEHSKEFTPRLCEVLGEKQLRVALRQAMQRADDYGFTNRGPVRLYIELMFLCGSGFDTDPQYPMLGKILNTPGDQMQRAERIYDGLIEYLENVSGPDAVNVHKALEALAEFARKPLSLSADNFDTEIAEEMARAFPQKAAYVGKEGLNKLIDEGHTEARTYGFPAVRGDALLIVLKFAFGHGCTNDPLYPWIAKTLKDKRIVDPAARAQRLEKKALTWLDHVLARPRQGVQA